MNYAVGFLAEVFGGSFIPAERWKIAELRWRRRMFYVKNLDVVRGVLVVALAFGTNRDERDGAPRCV